MMTTGLEILQQNAHQAKITSFEACQFNGQNVLFSASLDGTLNIWSIDT